MDLLSPLPAVLCLLVALATASVLAKRYGKPLVHERYASLDGLRGYMAVFVFLHHSAMWSFYLQTNRWTVLPSNFYMHLGQSSVAMFFMITGFLFFSKLIGGRARQIDWGRLYVSRLLRLLPLYLFVVFLLFIVVGFLSHGILSEPIWVVTQEAVRWLSFTVLGKPDLNGVSQTWLIVAGVTWSLPYEWLFYFTLPVLALAVGVKPPPAYLLLGIVGVLGAWLWHPEIHHALYFLGGISAAFLVKSATFRQFAIKPVASIVCIAAIVAAVALYPTAYSYTPLFLLSTAFTIIACGNTLFGLLTSKVSRVLGEISYSIYLLHGLTLFLVFHFILGPAYAAALPASVYWLVIAGITPILIVFSFLTFKIIESPAMASTQTVTDWLRYRLVPLLGLGAASSR